MKFGDEFVESPNLGANLSPKSYGTYMHETGSPNAPGNPGATGGSRRRPRRRGPKAIERSRLRAAAHQALLVAARCSAPTTPTPMPLPAPTPPPFGPTSTRLIKVVPTWNGHRRDGRPKKCAFVRPALI